jgi:Ion channel
MTTDPHPPRSSFFQIEISEFWSGDLGLTLVTISLVVLIFVITPLRQAGLPGRFVFDLVMCCLMIFGALALNQSRIATALLIIFVLVSASALLAGRIHPAPGLHKIGSILSTITLLLYVRIVLLVMFRRGRITWSRMQGGVCAYLLLGLAWASAYLTVELFRPGAFQFPMAPGDFDELISKLTYFSFCVLTTVGSNITPVSPVARSLTIAEAVVGQLFPAILIGALVAMAMQAQAQAQAHPKP